MRKVFILDTCITQTQQSIKNQLMRFTLMGNNLTPMWVNTVAPPASTFVICSEGRNISIRYSRDKASILMNYSLNLIIALPLKETLSLTLFLIKINFQLKKKFNLFSLCSKFRFNH